MIGLSSGSWAQVIANLPSVEHMTVVEINPAYLDLIPQYADVASILRNPKVTIEIDDGRRWLVRHPERQFDMVVMNTTYHFRAHATNLLSVEFLRLVRGRLRPGGALYYNTTSSGEVQLTGVTEFRHGLRLASFLAVSDRPLAIDKAAWRETLTAYRLDGVPVFDLRRLRDQARLEEVLLKADEAENEVSIRERCRGKRLITDDNMGTECTRMLM
jgi:spermidine synthase